MRPALLALAMLLLVRQTAWAAPPAEAPHEANVPEDIRQTIIEHFSPHFVVPETAIWKFDSIRPYLLGGTLVCGRVNYQNSLRQFVGLQPFYLVVKRGGRTGDGGLLPRRPEDDPTGSERATYLKVCKPQS